MKSGFYRRGWGLAQVGMLMTSLSVPAHALSTTAIIQHTLAASPHNLHYRVIGACFWLDCHDGICTPHTTLRVEHYLPDLVVSVRQKTDKNPWAYAQALDQLALPIGNALIHHTLGGDLGYGPLPSSTSTDIDTHFKEVDVIGNPALLLLNRLSHALITSVAKPFEPYYVSVIDSYAWRSPLIETALYPPLVLPGVRTIGSALNAWGNVYPRTGFILQSNDAKAAAVIAQRAVDIMTHAHQPHAYQFLTDECGHACHISEIHENHPDTRWQLIYPQIESTAAVFGENDTSAILPWQSTATQTSEGNYVWVLWRRYRGCIQGKGKYVGSVTW